MDPAPLGDKQVAAFSRLALEGLVREFPNKPAQTYGGPEAAVVPRTMHPVFFGCFDWHSAVHSHWMLVRLLRGYPGSSVAGEVRKFLDARFNREDLQKEADYFEERENHHFERMYGWAWLFRLAQELHGFQESWSSHLGPLERRIRDLTCAYLPRLSWPLRTGVHPDSGFALSMILDYSAAVGDRELSELAADRARAFYLEDRDYPTRFEPSGEDFFSSGLNEADLMRRVLDPVAFSAWLDDFLPGIAARQLGNLGDPVEVSDVTDGRLVHLAGLDLSRAWTMEGIASALPADDRRGAWLRERAAAHRDAGLGYVFSGHFEGEHWLASFAVYLLTRAGIPETRD